MATIDAKLVKELRDMTDSPMMECKRALEEANGDLDKAVDVLRTMGVAKAVKKAGRDTNEGTIGAVVSSDGTHAALVEVSCETDFVGTNPKFTSFAERLAQVIAENQPSDVEAFKALAYDDKDTVDAALTELIHTMGENMKIARFVAKSTDSGAYASYVHGGKLGVLVEFAFSSKDTAASDAFKAFAHDVAMQVAATNPVAATKDGVSEEVINHELEIYKAQAAESGKPEEIQEKMAQGRLGKFFKENVLTEQVFIKDSNETIASLANKLSKELGDTVEVVSFERFAFGE